MNTKAENLKEFNAAMDATAALRIIWNHEAQVKNREYQLRAEALRDEARRKYNYLTLLIEQGGELSLAEKEYALKRMPVVVTKTEGAEYCKIVNADEAKFRRAKNDFVGD